MRVLLISHGSGPYGAERVLLALAAGLADRGHDVMIDFPHAGPAVGAARELPGVRVRAGGRHRLPRGRWEAVGFFLTAPVAVAQVRRLVRELAPDLVWINSMYNPWAAVGARLAGRPVVWHVHEHGLPQPIGFKMAVLMGIVVDRVVAVSESLASDYRRYPWLRRRITVLRNPLLQELQPGPYPPTGPFTVGYVGQLEPIKRVPDLVDAVARLPDVRAVIVGEGKGRATVESAVRSAGLADRVVLTGYRDDVAVQLRRFHCVTIPATRESFGLVALEAMAAGVPVVAARAGALPEVLGDAALYHEPGNAADLAARIDRLRAEPGLARKLRERGLERAADYRRDHWLDRTETIMTDTVDQATNG